MERIPFLGQLKLKELSHAFFGQRRVNHFSKGEISKEKLKRILFTYDRIQ